MRNYILPVVPFALLCSFLAKGQEPEVKAPLPEAKVQVSGKSGLVETSATITSDPAKGALKITPADPKEEPFTAKVNDPANLIKEAADIGGQLPLKVLVTKEGNTYNASALALGSVNDFQHIQDRLLDPQIAQREDYKKVIAAFEAARKAVEDAVAKFNKGEMDEFFKARNDLIDQLTFTLKLIDGIYGDIRAKPKRDTLDKETQDSLVRSADRLRSDLGLLRSMQAGRETADPVDKAIYGFNDNFDVIHVKEIWDNGPAIALIRDKDNPGKPIGTGFLIAKDIIVTAGHCVMSHVEQGTMNSLEFVFFNEFIPRTTGSGYSPRPEITCSYVETVKLGRDMKEGETFGSPDLAILRIKRDPDQDPDNEKKREKEFAEIKPVRLSTRRVHYADALCGIGHPLGNQKQVHLNCRVLLPFELAGKDEIDSFATQIAARIGWVSGVRQEDKKGQSGVSDRELSLISSLYTRNLAEHGGSDSQYYVTMKSGRRRPAIGIEADTSAGDSGGPIFDIKTNAVVGILVAGQSERVISEVSLDEHEFALPIMFVVKGLGNEEEAKKFGVTIIK